MVGGRPNLVLAQVQVLGPGQDLSKSDLDWDLEWDLEWDLDLSLTICPVDLTFKDLASNST